MLVLLGGEAAPVAVDPFRGGATAGQDRLTAPHVAAVPNSAVPVRLLVNQATRMEGAGRAAVRRSSTPG